MDKAICKTCGKPADDDTGRDPQGWRCTHTLPSWVQEEIGWLRRKNTVLDRDAAEAIKQRDALREILAAVELDLLTPGGLTIPTAMRIARALHGGAS